MMQRLILLAFAVCLARPAAAAETIRRAADAILQHQVPDGAIVMGSLPAKRSHLIPYCGNFAALGLAAAYGDTHDRVYIEAAKRWVAWYAAHMNADGTICDFDGTSGEWESTGRYDSTDSYAATFLELLAAIHGAARDDVWLGSELAAARQAVAAIRLTLQPNGLTFARPQWPVMYLMDNTETARGLRAAARLGLNTSAAASAMEHAVVEKLWSPRLLAYAVGLEKEGRHVKAPEAWYPFVMANLMAVGWLPPQPRHAPLLGGFKQRFAGEIPDAVRTEKDLDHLVWWGIAARGAGDRALLDATTRKLDQFDARVKTFANPNLLGHLCRVVARNSNN